MRLNELYSSSVNVPQQKWFHGNIICINMTCIYQLKVVIKCSVLVIFLKKLFLRVFFCFVLRPFHIVTRLCSFNAGLYMFTFNRILHVDLLNSLQRKRSRPIKFPKLLSCHIRRSYSAKTNPSILIFAFSFQSVFNVQTASASLVTLYNSLSIAFRLKSNKYAQLHW